MTIKAAVQSYAPAEPKPQDWKTVRVWLFLEVLTDVNGNQVQAARALGVNRTTLRRVLKQAGVNIEAEIAVISAKREREAARCPSGNRYCGQNPLETYKDWCRDCREGVPG